MRNMINKSKEKIVKAVAVITNKRGEGYVDLAVQVLISIVLGGLILGALYALFSSTVIPSMVQKIQEMFNYKG